MNLSTAFQQIFNIFDTDHDGRISAASVKEIFHSIGQDFNEQLFNEIFSEYDSNQSGTINFEDFLILMGKFIVDDDYNQ